MITFPLNEENQNKEWKIILNINRNNNFPYKIINDLKNQIQHNKAHQKANNSANKKKWVTFIYYIPQIRKITNLFKHTDIKIAFKNKNNILQLIKPRNNNKTQNYDLSGIIHSRAKHANINTWAKQVGI